MIKIGKPIIENKDGRTTLKAFISNDVEGRNEWLWYTTDEKWGDYFCPEVADAFVLPMILRAVKTHQDIIVESSMSEKLFYNLNHSVLYAVTRAYEKKYGKQQEGDVKLECGNLVMDNYCPKGIGTGCSLGVDSFSVLKQHFFNGDCPSSYRITHLTLFNAGAFGSRDVEGARKSFYEEAKKIQTFADTINLPLVWVDSNTRSFFPELNFNWCASYLNMSIVLSMQKLWKTYLYASAYPVDSFVWEINDEGYYAPFLLPQLSTESTSLVLAQMNMNRSDKVLYISDDKMVQKSLYVCLKEQIRNNPNAKNKYYGDFLNCGQCSKCLRTMMQLEILGVLNDFCGIFDLKEWPNRKKYYIGEVIANKDNDFFMHDLYESMMKNHYEIPKDSIKIAKRIILKRRLQSIKRRIKSIF